ncbi:hypothetical protein CEX98_03735 [Pseudoalteromonas piscicida]|uniref:Uncharacterized protein n=1 Tax=Pseudoalteromonas piscicida TaxID=43662 RepID=A0A2A5JUJ8_PSEO7|nr:hypothetical protein CEX98_03735 [Pseudoalteromonas piscicida]
MGPSVDNKLIIIPNDSADNTPANSFYDLYQLVVLYAFIVKNLIVSGVFYSYNETDTSIMQFEVLLYFVV